MEKPEIFETARAAGLEKAVRDFPDDVVIAAQAAAMARKGFLPSEDPVTEPWPPMRPKAAP